MPIIEADAWRQAYFAHIDCPDDVVIPTDDADSWRLYPRYHFLFNKLFIAESQGLNCAPHGIAPPSFPVFSKPIYNLQGMGRGSRLIETMADYNATLAPGHFWSDCLTGDHVSSDVAVLDGRPVWWRHVRGMPGPGGTFDYWDVSEDSMPSLESYAGAWIARHMPDYRGMVNVETIGGRIIEVHLRFADQWPDLYGGDPFVRAAIGLYRDGVWTFEDSDRKRGYSVVLFIDHAAIGTTLRHPPQDLQQAVRVMPHVSSLQICFHEDKDAAHHAMPPGGFRVAIVNAFDLNAGFAARERLRQFYA